MAEGRRCTVSATDLELSIITSFEAVIENEGSITVPAKAILNFAQYNNDDNIVLETVEGTHLRCVSNHAKTMIAGEAASEYPTITPIENTSSFSLEAKPFLDALHKVTFASARTSLRPVLSGVYLRSEGRSLILVATDSYRLSEYVLPDILPADVAVSCIIPTKVLDELRGILSASKHDGKPQKNEKEEESFRVPTIDVTVSGQQIEIRCGNTKLLSRLIEGKFPDYKQIVPKDRATKVTIFSKDLLTVAKRMHYFAKEVNNNLTFSVTAGQTVVTTPQTQAGRDEATLMCEMSGADNKIALSSSYLLDFLGHTDEDNIEVHLTDSMHPAVFKLPSDEKYLHLIMPLRIQES